jgi:hypothetical protein
VRSTTVTKCDSGGWFRHDERLDVGRRDCSSLIAGATKQAKIIRDAARAEVRVPVHAVLSFVEAQWRLFANPFTSTK